MATGAKALSAIEFLRLCGRLKTLKRTGWVNNKVALPESVADNMYRMSSVADVDKHRMEKEALDEICSTLKDTSSAEEIRSLWNEYEAGSTEEAKIVKDFDKFEMILQADDYERAQNTQLDDFFQSTKGKFRTPLVQSWVAELTSQRNARLEDKVPKQ
ncbi:Hydrolase-HD superfamily protein [Phytophthora megakarya]|uniref:Hydrolase-HD superfamily protein n=1 Tax=Phytophthora megakarya TaxID=4795 RepID=A0A225V4L6_9STRA|nr:Hydrolase-HD superfamily protein [Phytophthora megakarya]